MFKIVLVNMPFASASRPSLGLTQLQSVLRRTFPEQVWVEIAYLNLDFAHHFGPEYYDSLASSMEHHASGLGDWFFRQAAFPSAPDNTDVYFQRFYPHQNETNQQLKQLVRNKRAELPGIFAALIDKYGLDTANLVGFTSTFTQNVASFALARAVKEKNPSVITVVGGANCESVMGREIARQVPQIDYVFSGPALKSFPEFMRRCLAGEPGDCRDIPGVFCKATAQPSSAFPILGQEKQVPDRGEELELDAMVELDYKPFLDLFYSNFPHLQREASILFETSRGCWWGEKAHCTFCGLNGDSMAYKAMKPENALKQFANVFQYADRCAMFECVDNIMPKNYLTEVFPNIRAPQDSVIFYEVKASLSESDLAILSRAGVKHLQPGIESLANSTLKLMKKGTTSFQNLSFLHNCIKHGIRPSWNLLVGFPGEQEEVYRRYLHDLPMFAHLFPPEGVFSVRFDRFSPYFDHAKEYGLDLHPMDYYTLTYPFAKQALFNLAYYFLDHNFQASYFVTMISWIGKLREKIEAWKKVWQADSGKFQPKLFFENQGRSTTIQDTRSGQLVKHDVGFIGKTILDCAALPRTAEGIAQHLASIPDLDVEIEIRRLQSLGLLFQEGDKYMNLVTPEEPPNLEYR
jgi:ribosomal peptide maturation radical SAM protein 1